MHYREIITTIAGLATKDERKKQVYQTLDHMKDFLNFAARLRHRTDTYNDRDSQIIFSAERMQAIEAGEKYMKNGCWELLPTDVVGIVITPKVMVANPNIKPSDTDDTLPFLTLEDVYTACLGYAKEQGVVWGPDIKHLDLASENA